MAKYIDLEPLINDGWQLQRYNSGDGYVNQEYASLKDIPPADVRPVVRGRWIPFTSEAAGDIWYCSACDVGFAHRMDFCPHCGADMKRGNDEG